MSQVTIELGRDDKNLNVIVGPANVALMGKFSKNNIPRSTVAFDDRSALCPDLPGWRIRIDYKNKAVKIFHPWYKTPAGDRAEKAFRQAYGTGFDVTVPAEIADNGDLRDLDEETVQTWLKWAYRLTHDKPEHRLASIIEGEFPKGVKEACEEERKFDRYLAKAHQMIAEQKAKELMEADARANVGITGK